MKITADQIRSLRNATGAPVMRAKKVLEEQKGNMKKAQEILTQEGFAKASKRESRRTGQGRMVAYSHHSGQLVAVVELLCETDFVARNELFGELALNLAMQVASMNPKNVKQLEAQEYIKDGSKKVGDLVKEVMAKTGENIRIGRIIRLELSQ